VLLTREESIIIWRATMRLRFGGDKMATVGIRCKGCNARIEKEGFCKECGKLSHFERCQLASLLSIARTLAEIKWALERPTV